MRSDHMFDQLRQHFGLSNKDIRVLEILKSTELDAQQLSKKTGIPHSRIYSTLNRLMEFQLVSRSKTRPYMYTLPDLKQNVLRFMKRRVDDLLKAEEEVMKTMRGVGVEYMQPISNSEEYTRNHLRIIAEAKKITIVAFHGSYPFILYPPSWDDFIKVRRLIAGLRETISHNDFETMFRIFQTYVDALAQEKESWRVIFEKEVWDRHISIFKEQLGETFLKKYLKQLQQKLVKYNIDVCLIDEFMPMEIDMSEDKVLVCLKHLGVTTGTLIRSAPVVKMYHASVEQKLERCQRLLPLIEQLVN